MRKILSLLLVVCMVLSMTIMVSAEEKQTTIRYVADGTSSYEVTVPSLMTPGETKQVTLEGTWTTEEKVVVSAPDSVVLTNDIDGDTEELAVTFNGFEVVGDNRETISLSEDIAVASMPADVIFGTWEGIIIYNVVVSTVEEEEFEELYFYIFNVFEPDTDPAKYVTREGITWGEYVELSPSFYINNQDKVVYKYGTDYYDVLSTADESDSITSDSIIYSQTYYVRIP